MMDLPQYFLADLPSEARLSGELVQQACQQLKRNRVRYRQEMSTLQVLRAIAVLAENWRDDAYPFRRYVLDGGPQATGFSKSTLARGLDQFFGSITEDSLHLLLAQEVGDPRRLDAPMALAEERAENRMAMVRGPELLAHFAPGNLPCPTWLGMIHGLLIGSAQFIKCAQGAAFLPRMFAHSLYAAHPKLGACLELAVWPGGREDLESPLLAQADCVMATGSDKTLAAIRHRMPAHARFVGHGHRVSFGYITKDRMSRAMARELARLAAQDVAAWNQLGCLSPHAFYVESDGLVSAEDFAAMLAVEMEAQEKIAPRGELPASAAADIAHRRAFYEVREAHTGDVRLWRSIDSTAWTVVLQRDPQFTSSCLHRFVYVKEVENLDQLLRTVERVRGQVSTIALAAAKTDAVEMIQKLARWGVTRVCPIGQMQDPPLTWRHDGRPALADLLTWTDWEL